MNDQVIVRDIFDIVYSVPSNMVEDFVLKTRNIHKLNLNSNEYHAAVEKFVIEFGQYLSLEHWGEEIKTEPYAKSVVNIFPAN